MQNRGPSPGSSGYRVGARYDKGCHSALDAHRVTPHPDAGSREVNLTSKLASIPGCRIQARHDKECHPVLDAHRVTPNSDTGSRKVNLTGNLVGIPGCRIKVRHDRSAKPSGLWEKAERKMTERDE